MFLRQGLEARDAVYDEDPGRAAGSRSRGERWSVGGRGVVFQQRLEGQIARGEEVREVDWEVRVVFVEGVAWLLLVHCRDVLVQDGCLLTNDTCGLTAAAMA